MLSIVESVEDEFRGEEKRPVVDEATRVVGGDRDDDDDDDDNDVTHGSEHEFGQNETVNTDAQSTDVNRKLAHIGLS